MEFSVIRFNDLMGCHICTLSACTREYVSTRYPMVGLRRRRPGQLDPGERSASWGAGRGGDLRDPAMLSELSKVSSARMRMKGTGSWSLSSSLGSLIGPDRGVTN
jgi:hypothetical protein